MHHERGPAGSLPTVDDLSALGSDERARLALWDAISLVGRGDQRLQVGDATGQFALIRDDGMAPTYLRVLRAGDAPFEGEWTLLTYVDAEESVVLSAGHFERGLPYERSLAQTCKAAKELLSRLDGVALLPSTLRDEALRGLAASLNMSVDDVLAHARWMDLGANHI